MLTELINEVTTVNTWVFNRHFTWESYFLITVERHCLERKKNNTFLKIGLENMMESLGGEHTAI